MNLLMMVLLAPVPPPKMITRENFVGNWDLIQGNIVYKTQLTKDGNYSSHCALYAARHFGTWTFTNNKIVIHEWDEIVVGPPIRSWEMKVDKDKGKIVATGNNYVLTNYKKQEITSP